MMPSEFNNNDGELGLLITKKVRALLPQLRGKLSLVELDSTSKVYKKDGPKTLLDLMKAQLEENFNV